MTQWYISHRAEDTKPGDDALPPVRGSASVEAAWILNRILMPGTRVDSDGNVHIGHGALHRLAMRLEHIAAHGLDTEDGFAANGSAAE